MGNVTIEIDWPGLQALMKSPEIAAVLEQEAQRRTKATGMEYVPDVYLNGKTRANAGGYDSPENVDSGSSNGGKQVSGYYRTTKSGKKIYVQSYRRKK